MRYRELNRWLTALTVLSALTVAGAPAAGQQPAATTTTAPVEGELADLWRNFLHFIVLGQVEMVESHGKALLASKPDPQALYELWIKTDRSGAILARARGINEDIAGLVDQLVDVINQGAKAVRDNPAEIAQWIDMLGGSPRQFRLGSENLVHSGEYAVPQMIDKLMDVETPAVMRSRLITVLPRLGKEAVRPLVQALAVRDNAVREVICRTLGKIGYPHAAAGLKELSEIEGLLPRTRDAALGALATVAGEQALKKPAAELFYELANSYYEHRESVSPDSRYDTANVWYWQEGLGLSYKPVPRAIFNDIYAMRAARKALEHDPEFYPAVTLWLAAYVRKEARLPAGAEDPTQPADKPGATYHVLASGAGYLQSVLARALNDGDLAVAKVAIKALAATAGAENLVRPVEGGAPSLVTALGYPAREVRYMAAEALALARPQRRFPGWNMVMPVLIEALRQTGTPAVVLADPDLDRRNKTKDLLRAEKVQVHDAEAFGEALEQARRAGGVDLVVLAASIRGPDAIEAARLLRSQAALRQTPVIVVAEEAGMPTARELARSDALVVVLPAEKLDAESLAAAMAEANKKGAGGSALGPQQAVDWAIRAAHCVRMLAMTRNPVYDLTDATASLIAATSDERDQVRVAAAEALAQLRSAAAQQALAELADDVDADDAVRLAAYSALSESIRMFGNQLTEKQVNAVIAVVVGSGDLKIRRAAAQVLGALALPSEKIKELILSHPLR